jgi:tetratricopeptide (TPR) repeat protein
MLRSFVISVTPLKEPRLPKEIWPRLALAAWILTMPVIVMPTTRHHTPRLPFNQEGLPNGTSNFLTSMTKAGKLFSPPNLAGFFAWKLYPKFLIYSDMKHPDMPSFYNLSTLRNTNALTRTLQAYSPDFFAAELSASELGKLLREQFGFKPVFVDDIFVLYARAPDSSDPPLSILQAIDPHNLARIEGREEEGIEELQRLAQQDRSGRRVREALWKFYFEKQNYAEATRYAAEVLEAYPEDPVAQFMMASIFEQTGRCQEALTMFAAIRPLLAGESQRVVLLHEGSCHYLTKNFIKANAAFEIGVNPYTDSIEPEYLFQYGFSAAATRNIPAAKRALEMLAFLVDPRNEELSKKAAALLEALDND